MEREDEASDSPDESGDREGPVSADEDSSDVEQEVRNDLGRLQKGPQIAVPGAELPVRGLVAMGIFVAVFMVVWMLLWAAAGGIGLGLGWILAAAAGAGVVVLYARRR